MALGSMHVFQTMHVLGQGTGYPVLEYILIMFLDPIGSLVSVMNE